MFLSGNKNRRRYGDTSVNRLRLISGILGRYRGLWHIQVKSSSHPGTTMTERPATVENNVGKCMLRNWEEERAVAAVDTEESKTQIQRHGHRGILTMDQESKMETVTTLKAAYIPPKGPGVRLRGIRSELLEKHIAQMISEKIDAERSPPTPKTDFCSTTQRDYCVEGFVPLTPEITQPPMTLSPVYCFSLLGPLLIGTDHCRLGTCHKSCRLMIIKLTRPSHFGVKITSGYRV
ncbi:sperm associated antigen 8 isoform X2 [Micropterus salmoides]|uniref:sperm associated antigen 8 isoform X2 n=1 Tax=Micropterus salmoides TaxID=27706 RepID=UPI0018ED1A2D|nr:sperm associated antigen 8 isoform X2 [Micropterus salmoides]